MRKYANIVADKWKDSGDKGKDAFGGMADESLEGTKRAS